MDAHSVDSALLDAFMQQFYGYGDFAGDYWLIGKEEGGAGSASEVALHLNTWDEQGRPELADVAELQSQKGEGQYFTEKAPLHPTWRGLVRLVLAAEKGASPTTEEVRTYQAEHLARHASNTAMLELLPLPARRVSHDDEWVYRSISQRPELDSRSSYKEWSAPWRAQHLHDRLLENQPRAVFFYSTDPWYVAWWKHIAGADFERITVGDRKICLGKDAGTVFVVMAHPGAHGVTNEFLDKVGMVVHDAMRPTPCAPSPTG